PGGTGLRLRNEMPISFSTNRDRTMEFTNGFLNYRVGGTPVFQVSDGGQLQIQSAIYFFPGPSVTPGANGMMTLEGTSNTLAKLKFKGTDGVVRSSSFTLS
ncbi:hypothetical protein, partial [Bacillus thuringiensis]|uniref:hypothetical protein n=1 Tax=Bacillus thuringiensis TaxID=1428 RepID=UPI002175F39D